MISFKSKELNTEINDYKEIIANLEVKTIKCPGCNTSDMERHGYYKRYINISGKKYYIRILRVRCKVCGHTHAILPDVMAIYSRVYYNKVFFNAYFCNKKHIKFIKVIVLS